MSEPSEARCVKLRIEGQLVPYADRRIGDDAIPRKFEDWHRANDFATSHQIADNYLAEIHPYYPEYADLERRVIDHDIEVLREGLRTVEREVSRNIATLEEQRKAIP